MLLFSGDPDHYWCPWVRRLASFFQDCDGIDGNRPTDCDEFDDIETSLTNCQPASKTGSTAIRTRDRGLVKLP